MHFYRLFFIFLILVAAISCGERAPATPLETFKTYTKAYKQKDPTTMKVLLSRDSMKVHEQEAKAQGVTVDDIVKRDALFSPDQTTVEFRNEKIEGDRATLEVKNPSERWETVPFVKEDGVWKIDKKGFADQISTEVDEQLNDPNNKINSPRVP